MENSNEEFEEDEVESSKVSKSEDRYMGLLDLPGIVMNIEVHTFNRRKKGDLERLQLTDQLKVNRG